ncbi:ATP-binding protein [Sphingobacterium sp. SRCM116780]|uniref:ATP-binding response regulator n=1 Tax=Sphingobacterium sp. SRCM116780 TaxID=2907623 RepID=UPI001F2D94B5|nr:ATP-binding protein [Sphingobacterium sp. SRCM116780]UIR54628.1 ATP-binding protein [Sphingobacterium sp. SRCM116780]
MILIVDDTTEHIFSLQQLLASKGFKVDTALSGEEALKKTLTNNYALIILDVQMPGMDGFEVASHLADCNKTKNIPIIFLSADHRDKRFITHSYFSGGIDYVTKPINEDLLLLKVKTFYRMYEQTLALNETQQNLRAEIESRKTAQLLLLEKADHLRLILESLPQIAFTVNQNGKIDFVNDNWFLFAASKNDFPACHPDDPLIDQVLRAHILEKSAIKMEVRIKPLNAELYRYHLLRMVPIIEKDEITHWVGTFTDIDDQKQIEQKKDEFLSIASHELKTPLTSMRGYVQLLKRSLHDSPNTVAHKYVDRVQTQLDKLSALIADLLDISKIDHGKLKISHRPFDLDHLIDTVIETIDHTHERKALKIERVGQRLHTLIMGDEMRIEQVLVNFMTNALKYGPDSDRIIIHTEIDDQEVKVSVQDFGIGIPVQNQAPIFDKFYRVEETSVRFQGLGLGLYICAEIIQQHKGQYGMKSQLGEGTTFYFTLPLN